MTARLPAALEVSAIVRQVEQAGGFAVVLRKGDPDRGQLLMLIATRGQHVACLERNLNAAGEYGWQRVGPGVGASSEMVTNWTASRVKFDADSWQIELDVADAERFIAETTSAG